MRKRRTAKSDASGKGRKQIDEDSWRAELEAISINEDSWWCMVILMVETIVEHSKCVSIFNAAAEDGKRKAIYSLSYRQTLDAVKVFSNQSLDKCPTIQGVCHYASKILNEDNGVLPCWLMARVIKYLIYRAKEENIGVVKKLADLERKIDEEYLIMQTVADWGQPKSKGFDPEVFNFKANTKLRKRNEEWRDTVYVDDAPLNGPNLYVILTGFQNPDLPEHLMEVDVPTTCILRILRPNEKLDRRVEQEPTESSTTKKLQFHEAYFVEKADLFNFWTTIEKRSMDPKNHPHLCDIAFLTFCPPKVPQEFDEDEYETMKKDMYNNVSYFVYDIYDLHRQHSNYLKSMYVDKSILNVVEEKVDTKVYEAFLDEIPPECVTVPLVLLAMLMQIEENEGKLEVENFVNEKGDANVSETTETEPVIQSSITLIQQKLDFLNLKFGLNEVYNNEEPDIELIHGDSMNEVVRLLHNTTTIANIVNNILSIFWHPSIGIFNSQPEISEKKRKEYSRHLDETRGYFDVEISNEEIKHYLHILLFDRMIFGPPVFNTEKPVLKSMMNLQSSISSLKRSKSSSDLTLKSTDKVHIQSDGNIDYGKIVPTFVECASLFDLIDPRELLAPGYLQNNIFNKRKDDKRSLKNFNDVEVLSRWFFLQLLYECLQTFDHTESQYFEPTDSLLLYFGNKRIVNGVHQEERICNIRTPVRLRDFNEYVVAEEKDWIRREEELYILQTTELIERLMMKRAEMYDETLLFRDEDFILPGSLKARDLAKRRDLLRQKRTLETETTSAEETVESSKKKKKTASKKKKRQDDKATTEKASSTSSPDLRSFSTTKQSLSVHTVEKETDYEFVGYDLGRLRVQIKNTKKTFSSADGTLVQVEMDDWLYKDKDIRITVTVHDYSLRLFQRINNGSRESSKMFHLTTGTGIILAFEKFLIPSLEERNSQDSWQNISVSFKASWPTGLLIEPIIGTEPDNPFYIRQCYGTSKRYGNINGVHEVCRKFLRNGTILKYLDDGKIIVLRPNGVIVTCTSFEKLPFDEYEDNKDDTNFQKGDRSSREKKVFKIRRKSSSLLRPQAVKVVEGTPTPLQQSSSTDHDSILSMDDTPVKVLGYTVLDHDGGWYEVADDLVVSVHHRLLVRTASDYEVNEKFTRRADGTNMLLNSNGELIVEFPDGTRITTGYTIEKEPVTCDWTEEEILEYFVSKESQEQGTQNYGVSFANLKHFDEATSRHSFEYEEDVTGLLIEDGFVSVQLTCRVEHKNYATVFYDQSTVSCTLSMPDKVRVSISGRGDYEVSMADGVDLKIKEDGVTFRGNSCAICGNRSTSTYNFCLFEFPAVIFSTTDVFKNVFEVLNDGRTSYHRKETLERQKSKSNVDLVEGKVTYQDREETENEGNECFEHYCDHERLCFRPNDIRSRIFSINRNLTAYEYLHRSVSNQAELATTFDNQTSAIIYPSPHRPKLRRLIMFEPLKPESQSKTLLTIQHSGLKPTNFDRRKMLRSTYSIPYDWPFPFGKNGDGIWANTHDLPLISNMEHNLPKLLKIRVLYGFKEQNVNAVVDLQRALGRYWMSLASGSHEPSIKKMLEMKKLVPEKTVSIYDYLENNLQNLALGIIKTIDTVTYKSGLEKHWMRPKSEHPMRSSKFVRLLKETATNKEEFDWYRRCMREGIVLPYFQNKTGTCFLWIEECMVNAVNISQANRPSIKMNKK
ncbi:uncharacterized protein LOC117607655 isoform X2 [Osmia lignaria lignaria]|uniref:uncharacterized protein LOC117607655 isoform X2 n=1 Tax=Osmia lignaria lignaria TaxID=1437193 RepID=UPI00402B28BE